MKLKTFDLKNDHCYKFKTPRKYEVSLTSYPIHERKVFDYF